MVQAAESLSFSVTILPKYWIDEMLVPVGDGGKEEGNATRRANDLAAIQVARASRTVRTVYTEADIPDRSIIEPLAGAPSDKRCRADVHCAVMRLTA